VEQDTPFPRPGECQLVARSLQRRLAMLSPQAAAVVKTYLQMHPDRLERTTYSGVDAASSMMLLMVEVLLSYEQLRLELQDQMEQHAHRGEEFPPNLYRLMNQMLPLEPVLIQGIRGAIEAHGALWDQEGDVFQENGSKKR
jgi:hypothetical protein